MTISQRWRSDLSPFCVETGEQGRVSVFLGVAVARDERLLRGVDIPLPLLGPSANGRKKVQAVWKSTEIARLADSALGEAALEPETWGLRGLGDASVHRWRSSDATDRCYRNSLENYVSEENISGSQRSPHVAEHVEANVKYGVVGYGIWVMTNRPLGNFDMV
jgi:hypothetical protein